MTSFIYLNFAVLLVHLSWVGFAQNNSTSSTEGKIVSNLNLTVLNQTNTSNICKLRMDDSAVENILRFINTHTTHVVEINVFIDSKNETRSFPELVWPWANEIGRTIISLKARTDAVYDENIAISSWHFITLNPGIEKVTVIVSEENYGCLPTGSNGSELVFDFLLHQLSHSDDTHNYKLCRAFSKENDLKQYNCCRLTSGGKLTICGEYSSYATKYINVMAYIFSYVGLSLTWHYLQSIPTERDDYEITDSPMSLSTIFYTVFMEGSKTPVKSLYRRLAFSLTAAVAICISFTGLGWIITSSVWALIFTLMMVASVVFTIFFFIAFVNLLLYLITGVYLNGSFYSPFVVPILVFLGYFWKNWKFFVEIKYLILKTKIHEVCQKRKLETLMTSSNLQENEDVFENTDPTSMPMTSSNLQENEENTENTDPQYTVNVEEGTVSKALYDKIREKMLPYNVVLFTFFVRMCFVANFCLIIHVMMLLAQEFNIAAAAQIMSTITVSTFPMIFDEVLAANSFKQIYVNVNKLEHDLDGIMKVEILTDDVVTVEVEGELTKVADAISL